MPCVDNCCGTLCPAANNTSMSFLRPLGVATALVCAGLAAVVTAPSARADGGSSISGPITESTGIGAGGTGGIGSSPTAPAPSPAGNPVTSTTGAVSDAGSSVTGSSAAAASPVVSTQAIAQAAAVGPASTTPNSTTGAPAIMAATPSPSSLISGVPGAMVPEEDAITTNVDPALSSGNSLAAPVVAAGDSVATPSVTPLGETADLVLLGVTSAVAPVVVPAAKILAPAVAPVVPVLVPKSDPIVPATDAAIPPATSPVLAVRLLRLPTDYGRRIPASGSTPFVPGANRGSAAADVACAAADGIGPTAAAPELTLGEPRPAMPLAVGVETDTGIDFVVPTLGAPRSSLAEFEPTLPASGSMGSAQGSNPFAGELPAVVALSVAAMLLWVARSARPPGGLASAPAVPPG